MPLKTVEDVARFLCAADKVDPDAPVYPGSLHCVATGNTPMGVTPISPTAAWSREPVILFPAWAHYRAKAMELAAGLGIEVDWQAPFDALALPHWKIVKEDTAKD
jgi:hypothetical protein